MTTLKASTAHTITSELVTARGNFFALLKKSPFPRAPSLNDRPNHRQARRTYAADIRRYFENERLVPRGIHLSSLTRQAHSLLLPPPVGLPEEAP
jgi:hypothetical protein